MNPHHRCSNVRAVQQNGVVQNDRRLQEVAHTAPAGAHDRLIAPHQPRATDVRLLHMGGGHDQRVSVPFARGKAAPGVERTCGRMRPVIHPDCRFLLFLIDVPAVIGDLLRGLVRLGPDPHSRERTLERIVPDVGPADPFGGIEIVRRPALRPPLAFIAQRNASGVAGHAAAVLIAGQRTPKAGDIHLSQCWRAPQA